MAKVVFSKLKCKINEEIKTINFADEQIEIKQYLPIQEKLQLIGRIVSYSHEEDGNYANPVKINVYLHLEIMFAYTNISFTNKQKEDIPKLYDSILSSGLLDAVLSEIPESELNILQKGTFDSIEAIYNYYNSIVGVMETLNNMNSNVDLEQVEELKQEMQGLTELPFVKQILPLMGQNG